MGNAIKKELSSHHSSALVKLYDTLNPDGLGCGLSNLLRHPNKISRTDYQRWIQTTSLDPIEDFVALRHSVCKGMLDAVSILYIPLKRGTTEKSGFDIDFGGVQLYDRIYREELGGEELLPPHLRFVSGLVISQRALPKGKLARTNYIGALKRRLVQHCMKMLQEASKTPKIWEHVWANYSWYIKCAACHDLTNSAITLLRYKTSRDLTSSLDDYVSRMPRDQKKIYFARGRSVGTLAKNPAVEIVVDNGKEVIFMTDPIDDFVVSTVKKYAGMPFFSVTEFRLDPQEALLTEDEKKIAGVIEFMKNHLKDKVGDIKVSKTLQKHPCCILTKGSKPNRTPFLQEALREHHHGSLQLYQPHRDLILGVNPRDPIINILQKLCQVKSTEENSAIMFSKAIVDILFNAARLTSGFKLEDNQKYQEDTWKLMQVLGVI